MHVITYYVQVYYMRIRSRTERWKKKKKKKKGQLKSSSPYYMAACHISHVQQEVQWNSVIARADGPGTFSRYCRVLVIPKWRIYQGKQKEIILARTPTAPCALKPDEDERRERGEGERGLHTAQGRLSLFFFVTGHHEMCPTGNLTTRWGWGEWRELLWPGMIENLSLLPRWLSTNSR